MKHPAPLWTSRIRLRLRHSSFASITLVVLAAACTDDAIVYPNRNLRPETAGSTSIGGEAGEAGAPAAGGMAHGGSGGAKAGTGGLVVEEGGEGGSAGTAIIGPVCGDGHLDPGEECDDGNDISGDGCSWDCRTACEICEQQVCPLYDEAPTLQSTTSAYDDCYKATGKIPRGPATGVQRAEVCQELVDCVRQENCAQTRGPVLKLEKCWCDKDWNLAKVPGTNLSPLTACTSDPDPSNPLAPSAFIPGKCASLFQDGSEAPTLPDVARSFTAVYRPIGMAFRLLATCDTRQCAEECLPTYFGSKGIATITADITSKANAAGESSLGDLVADSQRAIAGADFAFVSPQFISTSYPPDLLFAATPGRAADAPGRVLWSEALTVAWGHSISQNLGQSENKQTNTTLYKGTFTGQQIYDVLAEQLKLGAVGKLLVSGLSYTWDYAQPPESGIVEVRKAGSATPIDKAAKYTVAATSYLTTDTPPDSSPVPTLKMGSDSNAVPNAVAYEILGEYLKGLPQPVAPPELNRITCLNCPPTP